MNSLEVSVVIPAYHAWDTLPRVLDALAAQVAAGDRETIVVDSSADGRLREIAQRWPWTRVLALPDRTPQGIARNVGARAARGRTLAFLDADAVPAFDWLDELLRVLSPGVEMVAGAVLNGTPRNPWAKAAHILEFLEWVPPAAAPLRHAASCNLLVNRDAFEAAGGFASDVWTGEDTLLSFGFGERGTLAFAPRARVAHLNRPHARGFLLDQYKHGVGFSEICRRVNFPAAHVVREGHLGLAMLHRSKALFTAMRRHPDAYTSALRVSPLLAIGLLAWATGLSRERFHAFPALPQPTRSALRRRRQTCRFSGLR
jgi:glycosyltransferase involved in cell wall biosynthesis